MIIFSTPINFSISSESKGSLNLPSLSYETCDLVGSDSHYSGYIHIYLDKFLENVSEEDKEMIIEMIKGE